MLAALAVCMGMYERVMLPAVVASAPRGRRELGTSEPARVEPDRTEDGPAHLADTPRLRINVASSCPLVRAPPCSLFYPAW